MPTFQPDSCSQIVPPTFSHVFFSILREECRRRRGLCSWHWRYHLSLEGDSNKTQRSWEFLAMLQCWKSYENQWNDRNIIGKKWFKDLIAAMLLFPSSGMLFFGDCLFKQTYLLHWPPNQCSCFDSFFCLSLAIWSLLRKTNSMFVCNYVTFSARFYKWMKETNNNKQRIIGISVSIAMIFHMAFYIVNILVSAFHVFQISSYINSIFSTSMYIITYHISYIYIFCFQMYFPTYLFVCVPLYWFSWLSAAGLLEVTLESARRIHSCFVIAWSEE